MATYNGKCHISDEEWDGYLIIQAKYHQLIETPKRNADWLISQIDTELAKFADRKRGLTIPDFYLLATNVRLSASSANAGGTGEGGIDKLTRHLKLKSAELGIKGVHLLAW